MSIPTKLSKSQLKTLRQSLISAHDAGYHASVVLLADQYLANEPASLRAMLDRSHALTELRRFEEAEEGLDAALKIATETNETPDVIYGMLGNLHQAKGDFATAATMYQKQIELDPADATGFLFAGLLQSITGDLTTAIETLQRGTECEMGPLDLIHFEIGNVLRAQAKFPEAQAAYEQALRIDPKLNTATIALRDLKLAKTV